MRYCWPIAFLFAPLSMPAFAAPALKVDAYLSAGPDMFFTKVEGSSMFSFEGVLGASIEAYKSNKLGLGVKLESVYSYVIVDTKVLDASTSTTMSQFLLGAAPFVSYDLSNVISCWVSAFYRIGLGGTATTTLSGQLADAFGSASLASDVKLNMYGLILGGDYSISKQIAVGAQLNYGVLTSADSSSDSSSGGNSGIGLALSISYNIMSPKQNSATNTQTQPQLLKQQKPVNKTNRIPK